MLYVVLYGYETWSLTQREEYGLKVSEDRVLRKIFGLKGKGVAGGWKELHAEDLCILCSSQILLEQSY
jgi:hypothetical protein